MADEAASRRVLTFQAGRQTLALPAARVAEIVPAPRVTRVPQAPRALQGLANLRGRVTPILSLDVLLGAEGAAANGRVIVLEGADPVGLAVDQVFAMREAQAAEADDASDGVAEIVRTEDGAARLLRLEPLLAQAFAGMRTRRATDGAASASAAEAAPEAADLAFLQIELGGQAYALPLEQVREVTAVPEETTALPKAEAIMLGVMPLRGDLLALVSLRALLGLPFAPPEAGSRVVVVAIGGAAIGLLCDRVRGILRVRPGDVGAVPGVLNRGAGEARIDSIVRGPGGLVSVLAAERIFEEATVAAIVAEGAGRRREDQAQDGTEIAVEQFVLFRLGDETYGLPVGAVSEVLRLPETLTRVPRAPAFVAGVMNHRGSVVPLIDQRSRFTVTSEAAARQRRVIVAQLEDLIAGFVVDAVEQILDVPASALQPTPELAGGDTPIFDRVATVEHDGRLVLLVDPRQLLDQAERDIVRAVAARSRPAPA